jgi:uncharacterized protein YkwD
VDVLREGGCGGIMPAARPLRHNAFLDRAAAEWALGRPLPAASAENGFPGGITAGVHINGPDSTTLQQLRQVGCRIVAGREMQDVGLYRRGFDTWIVVSSLYRLPPGMTVSSGTSQSWPPASPQAPGWRASGAALQPVVPPDATARMMPAPSDSARAIPAPAPAARAVPTPHDSWDSPAPTISLAPTRPSYSNPALTSTSSPLSPTLANRALALINQARARGTHCGDELFGPAPPVSLSGTLDTVASGHATDMAQKNYFEHVDPAGHSPADRVRAMGYQEKLVGENIAYGPKTVDEVVQGWLDSPGHCENIMDPRFAEMGIALAPGRVKHGLYWVQVFAEPRA